MQFIQCSQTRCRVCGFSEILFDEAMDRELVVLAECPRCAHRWTDAPQVSPAAVRVASPVRVRREVASAA